MGQFPLNYVTAWQEKPVEWLTYSSVTLAKLTYNGEMDLPVSGRRSFEVDSASVRSGVVLRDAQQRQHGRRGGPVGSVNGDKGSGWPDAFVETSPKI
jgi:hypothetical protein